MFRHQKSAELLFETKLREATDLIDRQVSSQGKNAPHLTRRVNLGAMYLAMLKTDSHACSL